MPESYGTEDKVPLDIANVSTLSRKFVMCFSSLPPIKHHTLPLVSFDRDHQDHPVNTD